jgi:hypothetical protein
MRFCASSGWKRSTDKLSGAGVTVSPSLTGAPNDELYGNLGQDVVAKFDSFTLDFVKMTFSLGEPLSGAH